MAFDPYQLPPDLPVPVDDGGADHLRGSAIPAVRLESSQGPLDLADLAAERLVLYVYPRTGTPQSCGFRDHLGELRSFGARVAGVSAQTLEAQIEFADRTHIPYPVIADPELVLRETLGLPTFEIAGMTLYKRLALVAESGTIVKAFYPVFPPDRNAEEVVAWLRRR